MKRVFLFLIMTVFTLACENPTTENPSSGVSSNPNFFKGEVHFSDGSPIESAVVSFSHIDDTVIDCTDTNGIFEVAINGERSYEFEITYKDSLIYSKSNFVASSIEGQYMLELEVKSDDFIDSLDVDTVKQDSIQDQIITIDTTDLFSVKTTQMSYALNSSERISDTYLKYLIGDTGDEQINSQKYRNVAVSYIGHQDSETNCRYLAKLHDISQYDAIEYTKVEIHYYSNMASSSYSNTGSLKLYLCSEDWDVEEVDAIQRTVDSTWGTIGLAFNGNDADETPFFEAVLLDIQDDVKIAGYDDVLVNKIRVTVDITDAFKKWKDGENNFGFVMIYDEEYVGGTSNFFSLVSSDALSLNPDLVFTK